MVFRKTIRRIQATALAFVAGGLLSMFAFRAEGQAAAPVPAPTAAEVDPFSRYLGFENSHRHEPALVRFAGACGIDLTSTNPRYAQRPGEAWKPVPNLSMTKDDLETDFYKTVAVWHRADLVLVEQWGMELDTGDYYRLFFCLNKKQITLAESVSWRMAGFSEGPDDITWGYEHRWKLAQSGRLETSLTQYVGLDEKPMRAPKLDAETLKSLKEEKMRMTTWADLELPGRLLQ